MELSENDVSENLSELGAVDVEEQKRLGKIEVWSRFCMADVHRLERLEGLFGSAPDKDMYDVFAEWYEWAEDPTEKQFTRAFVGPMVHRTATRFATSVVACWSKSGVENACCRCHRVDCALPIAETSSVGRPPKKNDPNAASSSTGPSAQGADALASESTGQPSNGTSKPPAKRSKLKQDVEEEEEIQAPKSKIPTCEACAEPSLDEHAELDSEQMETIQQLNCARPDLHIPVGRNSGVNTGLSGKWKLRCADLETKVRFWYTTLHPGMKKSAPPTPKQKKARTSGVGLVDADLAQSQDVLGSWINLSRAVLAEKDTWTATAAASTVFDAFSLVKPLSDTLSAANHHHLSNMLDSMDDEAVDAIATARMAKRKRGER